MPHKHKPRRNKYTDLLLESDNDDLIVKSLFDAERENNVGKMSLSEKRDAHSVIFQRYDSADEITAIQARKMEELDRLYYGVFEDGPQRDGHMYLNKTRENLKAVYSYLLQLVSEITPILTCQPKNYKSIHAPEEEYRRSKVMEAMLNFQFDSIWHFRDDVFPIWLKHFLKYSLAIWKISYKEDNFEPDLKLSVVDRAFLRVDPFVQDIKDAKWVTEDQFISRSEVKQMVDQGYWELTDQEIASLPHAQDSLGDSVGSHDTRQRIWGKSNENRYTTVDSDDLVHIVHYWQANQKGLPDAYSVIAGGIHGTLCRHGRNPFPYKGVPYRAKSYDPNESQLDGTGLVEEFKDIQRQINNLYELRNKDIQNNVYNRKIIPEELLDEQSMQDWEDGNQMIRMSPEIMDLMKNDPTFDIRRYILDLGVRPTTDQVINQDLQFILGQGKENSFISDVFRGQSPSTQQTAFSTREQLVRNQGAFRPVYLQIMRSISEIGEICVNFYQSAEFTPVERIIQIVGRNRYAEVIQGWHKVPGTEVSLRSISPDELDIDVTIDTVSGADAVASRSVKNSQISELLQSIGQIPGAYESISKRLDLTALVDMMIENNGTDIERIRLTEEQQQQRAQEEQQQMEQQNQMIVQQQQQIAQIEQEKMQLSAQLEMSKQAAIQESRAKAQVQIDGSKQQFKFQENSQLHQQDMEKLVTELTMKIKEELQADLIRMNQEAILESKYNTSIGHGNDISR